MHYTKWACGCWLQPTSCKVVTGVKGNTCTFRAIKQVLHACTKHQVGKAASCSESKCKAHGSHMLGSVVFNLCRGTYMVTAHNFAEAAYCVAVHGHGSQLCRGMAVRVCMSLWFILSSQGFGCCGLLLVLPACQHCFAYCRL